MISFIPVLNASITQFYFFTNSLLQIYHIPDSGYCSRETSSRFLNRETAADNDVNFRTNVPGFPFTQGHMNRLCDLFISQFL